MATGVGQDVSIKIGANAIGEMKNTTYNINSDELDTTTFGAVNKAKTRKVSLRECSLDFSGFFDPKDAGQAAVMAALMATSSIGEIPALTFYPLGVAAATNFTGAWIVVTGGITGSHDGMVEVSFSLKSNGDITYTA